MRPPSTHGPVILSTTAAGPRPHEPVRAVGIVDVGSDTIGPMPQMTAPGFFGVKNSSSWMSPTPLKLVVPSDEGMLLTGMIVRAIRFQFVLTLKGITGWKFRLKSVRSPRSPPLLKLN